MKKPKVPCGKVCPKRTAECKRTCPDWAEYEAEYMAHDEEKRKNNQLKVDYTSYCIDRAYKAKK